MHKNSKTGAYARLCVLTAAQRYRVSKPIMDNLLALRWPKEIRLLGESQKTRKGSKTYSTKILYLLPSTQARRYGVQIDLCPASSAGCRSCCLCHSAGNFRFSNVQNACAWKTALWYWAPALFHHILRAEIRHHARVCKAQHKVPCVRLNGGSDLSWAATYADHPDVTFYEYTKRLDLVDRVSPNVHWTFSATEETFLTTIRSFIESRAVNVAIVFRRGRKPQGTWEGMPVLDGDKDDLRFLDTPGHIVALVAKGKTARDRSGFVRS